MLTILRSVGQGGVNAPGDVAKVRARLVELGLDWIGGATTAGPEFIKAIRLFQAIKEGLDVVSGTKIDGRVDPNGETLKWLNAVNAPRWVRMTRDGVGFVNHEAFDGDDGHDFGTSWLDDSIKAAAARYEADFRSGHPGATAIAVNDASLPRGGDTPLHQGHETGLVADLRLPRKDRKFGGITTTSALYDREVARAQLQAFHTVPLLQHIFLNDDVLIAEGLCRPLGGHDNHVHIEIRPPTRASG